MIKLNIRSVAAIEDDLRQAVLIFKENETEENLTEVLKLEDEKYEAIIKEKKIKQLN